MNLTQLSLGSTSDFHGDCPPHILIKTAAYDTPAKMEGSLLFGKSWIFDYLMESKLQSVAA